MLTPSTLAMLHSTDYLDTLGRTPSGSRLERILRSPNFRDGTFQNPVATTVMVPGKTLEVAKDWFSTRTRREPPGPLPSVALTREAFAAPPADDVRLAWLGHSTILMEMEGRRLLFDPVWSARSSPSQLVGPGRFQPAPLPLEQLPELTAVVLSHDHYDHLDKRTIQHLARAHPQVPFYAPLGVGAHLERWGVPAARIHELDWWEGAAPADGLRLVATPARHFSGRGLARNRTQWASWTVLGKQRRAFFGGDGGYFEGFAEIGKRFGPFDVTLLEIGAWNPNWGLIHLGPENALRAARDLRSRQLLPIHWGTFNLATHAWDEPITTLSEGAPAAGVSLLLPRLGQLVRASAPPPVQAWWREAR